MYNLSWQGKAVAERIQAYKFLECSAKSGEGLQEVFEQATRAALLAKKKRKSTSAAPTNPTSNATGKRASKTKWCSIV